MKLLYDLIGDFMTLKILGTGCPNCKRLEVHTREAVQNLAIDAAIEKVEDLPSIMKYGIMSTPALVLDEKVLFSGRVATADEIAGLIKQYE